TVLSYRVSAPAIVVISGPGGQKVRTLPGEPAASGTVTWDGRDDAGAVVPDGRYTLTLAGEQDAGLGHVTAVVDTNPSSLFDSTASAPFGVARGPCNLSCGGVSPPAWMPSEDAVLILQPGFPASVLKVPFEGEQTTIALDASLFFGAHFDSAYAVSPDGR